MSKIKISDVNARCFDCVYCEDGIDIVIPKNMKMHEEKFYRVKCPECGKVNYVLPVIQIEPIPFDYEDYKNYKNDKDRIKQTIYSSYK